MTVLSPITHPLLASAGFAHGFFTREGGISQGIYQGLNAGIGSRDDPNAVSENRRRVADAIGVASDALNGCYQIHSAVTRVAEAPWRGERPEGDAIVAANPGLGCSVLTADCAPVLLADPETRIVGAAHAGWKGALGGVVHSAVAAMQALGAEPSRILAVVGPCIAQTSYEVGTDFQERFAHHDPGSERFFKEAGHPEKRLFDLSGFVLLRLEQAGVGQAVWTGHDTCTDEARFYSNRRAFQRTEPDFGRQISAIAP